MPDYLEDERAVVGMKRIAETLGCCLRTCYYRREEWLNAGVIFYMRKGRPPRKLIHHFPSRLKAYTGLKASKGEMV